MKFIVTFVRQSKHTRRRMGKAQTVTINTTEATPSRNPFFGMTTPSAVERQFETQMVETDATVKVVDIREVA